MYIQLDHTAPAHLNLLHRYPSTQDHGGASTLARASDIWTVMWLQMLEDHDCYDPAPQKFISAPSSTPVPTAPPTPTQLPPTSAPVRPTTLPQHGPAPMVLNPPEPCPPTSEDNTPTFYRHLGRNVPEGEYLDLSMLEEGYPENYPDSPRLHWIYDLQCHIREKSITGEYDTMPLCMPSPMDLDPWPNSPTAQWLYNWEPYVNMQVPTPTMTSLHPCSPNEPNFSIHKHHNSGHSKDPEHPCY
jgi:hypothetical protein